jgi:hypothetical protein
MVNYGNKGNCQYTQFATKTLSTAREERRIPIFWTYHQAGPNSQNNDHYEICKAICIESSDERGNRQSGFY